MFLRETQNMLFSLLLSLDEYKLGKGRTQRDGEIDTPPAPLLFNVPLSPAPFQLIFTRAALASAGISCVCLSVCHKSVFSWNGNVGSRE